MQTFKLGAQGIPFLLLRTEEPPQSLFPLEEDYSTDPPQNHKEGHFEMIAGAEMTLQTQTLIIQLLNLSYPELSTLNLKTHTTTLTPSKG